VNLIIFHLSLCVVMHYFQNVSVFITVSFHKYHWVKPYSVSLLCGVIVLVSLCYGRREGGGGAAVVDVGVCLCGKTLFYEQLQDYAVYFI
jgi:hypothetical protein